MTRRHRQLEALKLILRSLPVEWVEELRFHPVRQWRFDLAIPALRIAIEYQGHGATGGKRQNCTGGKNHGSTHGKGHIGRHASITGMSGDADKENAAAILGWRVLKFTALHFDPKRRRDLHLSAPLETLQAAVQAATIHPGFIGTASEQES